MGSVSVTLRITSDVTGTLVGQMSQCRGSERGSARRVIMSPHPSTTACRHGEMLAAFKLFKSVIAFKLVTKLLTSFGGGYIQKLDQLFSRLGIGPVP